MVKNVIRRFGTLVLITLMIVMLIPFSSIPVYAATSGDLTLSISDIGARYTATDDGSKASWSASGNTITGNVISASGTCGDTPYETTLILTNNKSAAATLSFDYTIAQNSGTIQVAEDAVNANGSYSGELAAGGYIKVYLKSGSTSAATQINITNISLVSDVTVTTTFQPSENGTFTVGGTAVTEETSKTQSSLTAYELKATPAEGYQFMGWYNVTTGKYISTDPSIQFKTESDATITAKFDKIGTSLFETGGQVFEDLNAAVTYAQGNSQSKITLISDGTISGEYTIPEGITLLIPFDADKTMYTTTPANTAQAWENPSPYRTLTLAEDTSITVNGAISVSAKHHGNGNQSKGGGAPTGKYGYIVMSDNSDIIVNNNGALYVWGYISGNGTVTAKSGATVYENMQICDFRGGSASLSLANKAKGKSFLFNQYYIQNIESELVLESGANEYVYSTLYANSTTYSTSVHFIGNGGMFSVDEGGQFIKKYLPDQDRLEIRVEGNASINNLTVSLMGIEVSSQDYVLPITNNMSISVLSGTTRITQDISLLPGVKVNIAQGAILEIAENCDAFVYDRDEWIGKNYAFNNTYSFYPAAYSPTRSHTRTDADLVDTKIDVNGTAQINGYIYTTTGGADICSSLGTGKVVLAAGAGNETYTYQVVKASTDVTAIDVTPAKLHNADGSYTETQNAVAGTEIYYVNGIWGGKVISFDANGGDGSMDEQTIIASKDTTLNTNTFTRKGYEFIGWNTDPEGKGTPYPNGATVNLAEDTTLYAQWTTKDGWFTDEVGKAYYQNGELQKTGWTTIDEKTYYLDTETGYAATDGIYWLSYPEGYGPDQWDIENNTQYIDLGYEKCSYFIFDADGIFQDSADGMYALSADTKVVGGIAAPINKDITVWAVKGELPWHPGLVISNEDYYYFTTGYFENGATYVNNTDYYVSKPNDLDWPDQWGEGVFTTGKYTFDTEGKLQLYDGFTDIGNSTYYYVKGVKIYAGLIKIDDDYYYVNSSCKVIKNQSYTVSKTNGLLPAGTYTFDSDGKMIREEATKNGIVKETEDTWYYYVNGVKTYAGLILTDGDYYYVNSNFEVIHGRNYFISKTNGLMEKGTYEFDVDGKMVLEDTTKNGIVKETEDTWYYYVDGVKTYAGLIQIDGEYYYVNSSFKVIHNQSYYVSKTNGLMPQGTYEFDADGKMVVVREEATKNGIVKETEDTWYYYVNGVKTYAGLIQIDGDYYYVNSSFKVIHGQNYFISKTNGLLDQGTYEFDAEGKMIIPSEAEKLNGIVKESDDTWYYYVDGVKTYAGLIQLDGAYYYVNSSFKVIHNQDYYISKTNGLLPQGSYTFDEDGKMQNVPDILDGVVEINGSLYYYKDGVLSQQTGLIPLTIEEDEAGQKTAGELIYVQDGGKLVCNDIVVLTDSDIRLFASTYSDVSADIVVPTAYRFNENGILTEEYMVAGGGTEKIGEKLYLFDDEGYLIKDTGLYAFNGDYYYVQEDYSLVRDNDCFYVGSLTDLPEDFQLAPVGDVTADDGAFGFDSDGKLILAKLYEDPDRIEFRTEEDGNIYFYFDGKRTFAGLIRVGDFSESGSWVYKYVNRNGKLICNESVVIEKNNGLYFAVGAEGVNANCQSDGTVENPL